VAVEDVEKKCRRKIRILVEGNRNSWTGIAGTLSCIKKKIYILIECSPMGCDRGFESETAENKSS